MLCLDKRTHYIVEIINWLDGFYLLYLSPAEWWCASGTELSAGGRGSALKTSRNTMPVMSATHTRETCNWITARV